MSERASNDKIYLGNLLAYYESFLTEKQREYMRLYYQEDYSLQEIADIYHVSRAGIHTQIKHAQNKLLSFETQLHTHVVAQDILPSLEEALNERDWLQVEANISKLKEIIKGME